MEILKFQDFTLKMIFLTKKKEVAPYFHIIDYMKSYMKTRTKYH